MSKEAAGDGALRREHDSVDDFEHLEHEASPLQEARSRVQELPKIDKSVDFESGVPATPPPSADSEKYNAAQLSDPFQALSAEMADPKTATMAFMETERSARNLPAASLQEFDPKTLVNAALEKVGLDGERERQSSEASLAGSVDVGPDEGPATKAAQERGVDSGRRSGAGESLAETEGPAPPKGPPNSESLDEAKEFLGDIRSSVLPAPEKSPTIDFLADERSEKPRNIMDDDSWNVVEKPSKDPVNVGSAALLEPEKSPTTATATAMAAASATTPAIPHSDKFEMSHDFVFAEAGKEKPVGETETGESEFESEPEPSPAKVCQGARQQERAGEPADRTCPRPAPPGRPRLEEIEIAPKQIFKDMGIGTRNVSDSSSVPDNDSVDWNSRRVETPRRNNFINTYYKGLERC
ncbi:hypothetical protein KM043_000310 [Ampulex compressa]|nr:hypothetical protein KM043_000310 [Ampulex compressa]